MVKILRHQNIVWAIFFGIIAGCAACYFIYALVQIYRYERLSTALQPATIKWSIGRKGNDAFALRADYTYSFNGKLYEEASYWHPYYLNEWAAKEAIERLSNHAPAIWIDPSSPISSALQKEFPLKAAIYASILCGLVAYLIWLDRYFIPK